MDLINILKLFCKNFTLFLYIKFFFMFYIDHPIKNPVTPSKIAIVNLFFRISLS